MLNRVNLQYTNMQQTITYSGNTGGKLLADSWIDVRKPDDNFFEGNILDVIIGKNYAGSAKIIEVTIFPYSRITNSLAYCVCNNNKYALDKILRSCYGESIISGVVCSMVLQWNRRHLPTQVDMFGKWWTKAQEKHTVAYMDMPEVAQKEMFTISNA